MKPKLDIRNNRKTTNYTTFEFLKRILWGLMTPFFRFSPRVWFGWRRYLLKIFGARIGNQVHIYNSAKIYLPWNLEVGDWSAIGENTLIYNLGPVKIGKHVTISHRAHLCAGTHDYKNPLFPLVKQPIDIGDKSWICADTFIGPGVSIGEGAVVGAGSVTVKDVKPWHVVAGNPAIFIKKRVISVEEQN